MMVPLLLLFGFVTLQFAWTKQEALALERLEIAKHLSLLVDRELALTVGFLRGLVSQNGLRKSSDIADADPNHTFPDQPGITNLFVFDQSGAIVGTSSTMANERWDGLSVVDIDRVFAGNAVITPVRGNGLSNATVIVAVPSKLGGESLAIAAEVKLAALGSIFQIAGIKPNWAAAVVDMNGNFIARNLDAEARVGTAARPELAQAALSTHITGTFNNTTHEGVSMENSFVKSNLTGWTSVIAIPSVEIAAPLREAVWTTLFAAVAALVASVVLSSLMAARISKPVLSLSEYAKSIASGKPAKTKTLDIVEFEDVRASLEKSLSHSAQLAALVATSADAIIRVNSNNRIETWNLGAERLFGYKSEDMVGQPKSILVPDGQMNEFHVQRDRILNGEIINADTVRRNKFGKLIPVEVTDAPISDADGEVIAYSTIIRDLTERKAAEQHQLVLLRELAHRNKNQLAVIQSIAQHSGRHAKSFEEFLKNFSARLQGLASSHDLIAQKNWTTTALVNLVRSQLSVFEGFAAPRIELVGPEVEVNPTAAEALGMAFHELATNSLKYGALSSDMGKVAVRWNWLEQSEGQPVLHLSWCESGGPIVNKPERTGFGTMVLDKLVARSLDGRSKTIYEPSGLKWEIEFPLRPLSA